MGFKFNTQQQLGMARRLPQVQRAGTDYNYNILGESSAPSWKIHWCVLDMYFIRLSGPAKYKEHIRKYARSTARAPSPKYSVCVWLPYTLSDYPIQCRPIPTPNGNPAQPAMYCSTDRSRAGIHWLVWLCNTGTIGYFRYRMKFEPVLLNDTEVWVWFCDTIVDRNFMGISLS